jgi:homocysteine S-methyltransferase
MGDQILFPGGSGGEPMPDHLGRDRVREIVTSDKTFMTFAGIETYLMFLQRFPLREFCAFEVLDHDDAWEQTSREFLRPIADACARNGHGLIADSFVWRASPAYVAQLGYREADVSRFNREGVRRVRKLISEWRAEAGVSDTATPVIVSADVGPRGDAYQGGEISIDEAVAYHTPQMQALADSEVDLVVALTMTSVNETVGLARVAKEHGVPIGVSATVETDGSLPTGWSLAEFVMRVDDATDGYPVFHMVNCAHPQHLAPTLAAARESGAPWVDRIKGFRANASTRSHDELDNSPELDRGDVADLAKQMAGMHADFSLKIVGGCCGTDAEHIQAIAKACAA